MCTDGRGARCVGAAAERAAAERLRGQVAAGGAGVSSSRSSASTFLRSGGETLLPSSSSRCPAPSVSCCRSHAPTTRACQHHCSGRSGAVFVGSRAHLHCRSRGPAGRPRPGGAHIRGAATARGRAAALRAGVHNPGQAERAAGPRPGRRAHAGEHGSGQLVALGQTSVLS